MLNNKGITLIEVILTFALIGIFAVAVLNIFNTGLVNIVNAGNLTKAVYNTKIELDDDIKAYENTTTNELELTITITIPGVLSERDVIGKFLVKSLESGKQLYTFVP